MNAEDERDRQALSEMQEKLYQTSQLLQRLTVEERRKTTQVQRAELTGQEVEALPDDTRTYRAVGKAYFFAPKADINTSIKSVISSTTSELESIRAQHRQVEDKARATQEEFNELLRHSTFLRRNPQLAAA